MEFTALFCKLCGEAVDRVCARFFNGRNALANRVHRARRLSLEGGAFLVHKLYLAVEVSQAP